MHPENKIENRTETSTVLSAEDQDTLFWKSLVETFKCLDNRKKTTVTYGDHKASF